ncbi:MULTISPECIES: NAD(P)-binding domain-containing protein [Pseudoalteromonas]|uniref:NAD(P)-binding domain-containing protein n=1 Tax=Pseudoalteromonas TaxID=53246 RepID=UPI00029A0535|nr:MULTISPECIES: NAD(P)-binding domain-containing protein [Pseudoalteromonas]QUI69920.1 NAD(P)-binding domain-containing protein [Pseudoalteromonas sp. M8]WJE09643.1 NAD(P)-binding domain-containing protein [Pseudoalteromonas sp. JC3]
MNSTEHNTQHIDHIIIGAGPAGVQLGYYFERDQKDYLILEAGEQPGNFYKKFPRHRKLISINKRFTGSDNPEFNMRHDWNSLLSDDYSLLFKDYDKEFFPQADSLVTYMQDYVNHFDIKVRCNTRVVNIDKEDALYRLTDQNGNVFLAKKLIVASGFLKPHIPQIKGIELAENYTEMSIDTKDYENQTVLVIGKGNSAFETADHLVSSAAIIHLCSPNSVNFAWKTHYVGHLRAVNNNVLDTYQLKSQNAVLDAEIMSIECVNQRFKVLFKYKHAEGELEELWYDKVLCCTGFAIDTSLFSEETKPELTIKDKYPKLNNDFESVNQKNMYFAGTLTHSLDYKMATSGFIHGFRYNSRALNTILNKKQGEHYPEVTCNNEDVAQLVLDQVNESGAMWQQPGFIGDYFYPDGDKVHYGFSLPINHVLESLAKEKRQFFTVTLEYGIDADFDPFTANRIHRENVAASDHSQFLHPIIREYQGTELVSEHHVIEDLLAIWKEDIHLHPLQSFINEAIRLVQKTEELA